MPLQLLRGDSLLRVYHDRKRKEPFGERQVRIVEDRAGCGRELLLAGRLLALVNFAIRLLFSWRRILANFVSSAGHTADAIRPAQFRKFSAAAWLPAFFLHHLSTEIVPSIGVLFRFIMRNCADP